MMHLTHPDALHFDQPALSYWEATANPLKPTLLPLRTELTCDVAIIGGGFTGLSAAIELATSGIDVCVLEAGHIGWGASGRNGGFACIGSHKLSTASMIKTYGLASTQHFHRAMKDSVALVADNCQRHGIDAQQHGQGEITMAHRPNRMDALRKEQQTNRDLFGETSELLSVEELKAQGLHAPKFHGGLKGAVGFGIHPLNYVRGLANAAAKVGAKLFPHSKVTRWEETGDRHILHTTEGRIAAKRVLVATNGYTPENLSTRHAGRILPALSSIIVTRPLRNEEQREQGWTSSTMAYDSRNLLHYFRLLPDGRFLFGGRGGTDSSNGAAETYRAALTARFHDLFPAWAKVEITHAWRGFVCLAADRVPYIGALNDNKTVWTALAYHGNGVAMGSWSGRAVARLMQNKTAPDELPKVITRRLAKFPLPMFRPVYLKGAYLWYGWQDGH